FTLRPSTASHEETAGKPLAANQVREVAELVVLVSLIEDGHVQRQDLVKGAGGGGRVGRGGGDGVGDLHHHREHGERVADWQADAHVRLADTQPRIGVGRVVYAPEKVGEP